MNLATLQQQFSDHLLGIPGKESDLLVTGPFAPSQLMQLYRNNFYISLSEYLQTSFPVCMTLVGEEFFQQLSKAFIRVQPPQEASLEHYQDRFPAFITHCHQAEAVPYLSAIASVELAMSHARNCTTRAQFPFAQLASLTTEQQGDIFFSLATGAQLISTDYPMFSIWKGVKDGDLDNIDMTTGEQIIVCPSDLGDAKIQSLTPIQHQLLEAIQHQCPIQELATIAAQYGDSQDNEKHVKPLNNITINSDVSNASAVDENKSAFDFQTQLSTWISQGIITSFSLSTASNKTNLNT